MQCSPAAPCPGVYFEDINITTPRGETPAYNCYNVVGGLQGLPGEAVESGPLRLLLIDFVQPATRPRRLREMMEDGQRALRAEQPAWERGMMDQG